MTEDVTPGLVISAKTDRDADSGTGFRGRFVSPDALAQAAGAFSPAPKRKSGDRRSRHVVELSPGSVRVSRFSPVPHEPTDNYKERTAISEWTRKSRAAMTARLCSLDYEPMLGDLARAPAMVTLTYPGDWEKVAPDGASAKRHLRLLRQRYERQFREPWRAVWKMEFQRRQAVHFHIFCVPPVGNGFREWLSKTWAEVVGHPDREQRRRHEAAGTGIDYEEGMRSTDAKRVAIYFAKHGSPNSGAKEYQNQPPDLWLANGNVGRFWGYWGLSPSVVKTEVTREDALFIARVLRRWARANMAKTRPKPKAVDRVTIKTGEVTTRNVRRRPRNRMSNVSGFVSLNDGSVMGQALARAVQACRR
jgi:hypothetical protein